MVLKNKIAEEGKLNKNPVHLKYELKKKKKNLSLSVTELGWCRKVIALFAMVICLAHNKKGTIVVHYGNKSVRL